MNVVDSSAWLEYFADGPNAGIFEPSITDIENLLVPSIVVFEVFKRVLVQRDVQAALYAIAQVQRGEIIELGSDLAMTAAVLSVEEKLPLADSIILATARSMNATLWTQDGDFEGVEGVEYFPKAAV